MKILPEILDQEQDISENLLKFFEKPTEDGKVCNMELILSDNSAPIYSFQESQTMVI